MMHPSKSFLSFLAGAAVVLAGTAVAQVTAFPDVPRDAFFAPSVGKMVSRGIVRGYESGRFGPEDPVTRGQLSVLLDRYDQETIEPLQAQIALIREELGLGVCGDGEVQTGEECDDGNQDAGDGCGMWCQQETAYRPPLSDSSCPAGVRIGQTFPAEDGCNTCTCTRNGIACTEMACEPEEPIRSDRCLSDEQCGEGSICSTRYGDCRSACEPDAEVCIQACAGFCSPDTRQCRPHVCADGSVHPACTPEGHSINYLADPCRGIDPRCGDGFCEELEKEDCNSGDIGCFSCTFDCGEKPNLSCREQQGAFETLASENKDCSADTDCIVFQQSCPFVTCGVAIRRDAEGVLQEQANAQIATCQEEGAPLACASCIANRAICERGQCALQETTPPNGDSNVQRRCATFTRDGTSVEQCAVCGDGTCTAYERCTASSCSGTTCTTDCGGLYCPQDCGEEGR